MPDYHVGVMNHEKTVLVILCQDHEVVILCDDNNFSKWITKIFCDHVDINLKKKKEKKKKESHGLPTFSIFTSVLAANSRASV